jgi:ribosomal protein L13E
VVLEGRVRNTTFRDCRIYAPRDESSTFRPIRMQGATATRFEGGFAEMMATAPASPANALFDLGISTSTATYSGDAYQTVNDGVFIGKGFEARNIRNSTFAVRTTRTNGLRLDGMRIKRAAAASAGLVRTLVVVGGSNNDIFLDDNDFTDVANEEETAIDDTNAIVRRGPNNLGIKAPVQAIENDNNDNAIIGRGVTRAELTTTTVTYAITLNAPVEADNGNVLTIVMVADGGFNVTMSLTNVTNLGGAFTTATWGDVGDALVLVPMNGVWWLLANNGVVLS